MDFMTSAVILSWAAIVLLALVVSGLVRQVHQLSRGGATPVGASARVGLPPGAPAPEAGELLGRQEAGNGGLLLFLSADCRTCTEVLAEARRLAARTGGPAVRALYAGPAPEPDAGGTAGPVPVHAGRDDLFSGYDVIATPFAVAVDGASRVLRSAPLGATGELTGLLDDVFPRTVRS